MNAASVCNGVKQIIFSEIFSIFESGGMTKLTVSWPASHEVLNNPCSFFQMPHPPPLIRSGNSSLQPDFPEKICILRLPNSPLENYNYNFIPPWGKSIVILWNHTILKLIHVIYHPCGSFVAHIFQLNKNILNPWRTWPSTDTEWENDAIRPRPHYLVPLLQMQWQESRRN